MSIEQRRADIAEHLSVHLSGMTIDPYRPPSPVPFRGWLQIEQIDRQGPLTFNEVRLTVECQILVAADRTDFEKVSDSLSVQLLFAVQEAGGRGVTIQPFTETMNSTTFYHLSAKFITECEVA